ncbi:MAG: response regulator [Spirochaetota bacterium]
MEKVILVDDEPASLTGLRTCIDWNGLGLEICAEARNGQRAMELVYEHAPAVVIADVRMPFVDGVELARRINEAGLTTKIVLISAYPDLDNVTSGFRHEAVDFVLKPIQVADLVSAVESALSKRRAQRRIRVSLREKFLVELVAGLHARNRNIRRDLAWLGLDLPTDCPYLVCIAKADESVEASPDHEIGLASAGERLQALLNARLSGVVFRSLARELVCLIPVTLERSQFVDRFEDFLRAQAETLEKNSVRSLRMGVGTEVSGLSQVHRGVESARIALEQRFFDPGEFVYYADIGSPPARDELDVPPHDLESIRHAVAAGNRNQIMRTVRSIIDEAVACGNRGLSSMHAVAFRIMMEAADTLIRMGDSGSRVARKTYEAWRRIEDEATIDDFKNALTGFLLDVCETVGSKRRTHAQALVDGIKHIVATRYGDQIAISTIAAELEYTDSHICNVFKKETGETINEYLTQYRIRQATLLLRDHALRLYEICDRVGYKDYKHFVTLFKRYHGMSPSEYRNRLVYEE